MLDETAFEVSPSLVLPDGTPALDSGRVYLIPCSNHAREIVRILREDNFETLEQVYDESFSKQYGFFRSYVRQVIYRYPWPRPLAQTWL